MMLSPSGCGPREEVVDVDFTGDCSAATGEYAKDIFIYLREAEVGGSSKPTHEILGFANIRIIIMFKV